MGQSEPDFRRSFSAQIGPARVETLRVYSKSTVLQTYVRTGSDLEQWGMPAISRQSSCY